MGSLFVSLYRYFSRHAVLFYSVLAVSVALMCIAAMQLRFTNDISDFFRDGKDGKEDISVLEGFRAQDMTVVMVSAGDGTSSRDGEYGDVRAEAAEALVPGLDSLVARGLLEGYVCRSDGSQWMSAVSMVYGMLPYLYEEADYARLDSLLSPDGIHSCLETLYSRLVSPSGFFAEEMLMADPLGIGYGKLSLLSELSPSDGFVSENGYLYSSDGSFLVIVLDPSFAPGDFRKAELLVGALERMFSEVSAEYGTEISYYGSVPVSYYNEWRIKKDTYLTTALALAVIVAVVGLAFRNRRTVFLILAPVAYGVLFALAAIALADGEISIIAVGAGSAVMGIALSYSIHILAHCNHYGDPERIISDLAFPLAVGSITTIGAFLGLLFTRSGLLRDFGLFSSMTLVGTALFCLVFLPHFLGRQEKSAPSGILLKCIERINSYRYDRNPYLVGLVVLLTVISLFFFTDVRFDGDMSNLNYEPAHIRKAHALLESAAGNAGSGVYVVTGASADERDPGSVYGRTEEVIDSLVRTGVVASNSSAAVFVPDSATARERLERWNLYWSGKRGQVMDMLVAEGLRMGFREDAFDGFKDLISRDYTLPEDYPSGLLEDPVMKNWISVTDGEYRFVNRIVTGEDMKDTAYGAISREAGRVSVMDRGYFVSRMNHVISEDFNTILLISSMIVFLVLLITYGRLELALLSILPMAASWVIILGFMAVAGIEFNVVSIILSTFIFGIGDDFSIFIMDGLLSEYRDGRKVLSHHKLAIFFSVFTIVVGLGSMLFAEHPALRSVAVISVMGMLAVLLVSYTLQPAVFRLMVTLPVSAGGRPFTVLSVLRSLTGYLFFALALLFCSLAYLFLLPFGKERRARLLRKCVASSFRGLVRALRIAGIRIARDGEPHDFTAPAVMVANHMSFLDVAIALSLSDRMVIMVKGWVWKSPLLGHIVRGAGYIYSGSGYEQILSDVRKACGNGCSLFVFPEGSRSGDGKVHRFHKGAFVLAEDLSLPVVPVSFYGTGNICPKGFPYNLSSGRVAYTFGGSLSVAGQSPAESARLARASVREGCRALQSKYAVMDPFVIKSVTGSYVYKSPVLEWYVKVKLAMEDYYRMQHSLLAPDASIVDLGCGYGQMDYILHMYSPERKIYALDYDGDKIGIARHSYLASGSVRFEAANVLECDISAADAYFIYDMLHYLEPDDQRRVISRCARVMNDGGFIFVRDGDSSASEQRHRRTENTEKWSVGILHFNRSEAGIHFVSASFMRSVAQDNGLVLEVVPGKSTSNTIYIFRKKGGGDGQV